VKLTRILSKREKGEVAILSKREHKEELVRSWSDHAMAKLIRTID
jgi:hypothetical protein